MGKPIWCLLKIQKATSMEIQKTTSREIQKTTSLEIQKTISMEIEKTPKETQLFPMESIFGCHMHGVVFFGNEGSLASEANPW